MKKLLIISFLVACSCSNIKAIYNNESQYLGDQSNQPMLKTINATEASKTIISFTTGFSNESIVLTSNNKVLTQRILSTMSSVGLAGYEVVSNREDVKIEFLNTKINYTFEKVYMQKYKYVYVGKKNGKIIIEYSNNQRKFG